MRVRGRLAALGRRLARVHARPLLRRLAAGHAPLQLEADVLPFRVRARGGGFVTTTVG
jgi:hypothetical protein